MEFSTSKYEINLLCRQPSNDLKSSGAISVEVSLAVLECPLYTGRIFDKGHPPRCAFIRDFYIKRHMDYKKDNQNDSSKTVETYGFLDANTLSVSKDTFLGLSKKTQKVVAAIYMVTDYFEDSEPLKVKLRTEGIALHSKIQNLEIQSALSKNALFEEIKIVVRGITDFIEIGTTVGLISIMNGAILIEELSKIKKGVEEIEIINNKSLYKHPHFEARDVAGVVLHEDLFKTDFMPKDTNSLKDNVSYKGHDKDTVFYKNTQPTEIKTGLIEVKRDVQKASNDVALKINRRNNILRIIKDKKEVTIKDISALVSDCSEKTIQRELMSLIAEGVLKKEGDKRWSRYMIA